MTASLLKLLLAAAGRSAEQGTLLDIVQTVGTLVRLIEPLLEAAGPEPAAGVAEPDGPAMRPVALTRISGQ